MRRMGGAEARGRGERARFLRALFAVLPLVVGLIALGLPGSALALPVAGGDPLERAAACGLAVTPGADCAAPVALPLTMPAELPRLVGASGGLWASTALDLDRTGTVAPIPLPGAGWLILVGLGALGLTGRRRADALPSLRLRRFLPGRPDALGTAPLRGVLRGSALSDTDRFFGRAPEPDRRPPALGSDRLAALCARPHQPFPPGTASAAIPCGSSAHSYPPLAERAPPLRARRSEARPLGSARGDALAYPILSSRRHAPAPLGHMAVLVSQRPFRDLQAAEGWPYGTATGADCRNAPSSPAVGKRRRS